MRLWSIHPQYLDSKGLVALWREALLAQKVLQGETRGYKNHPQLIRFLNTSNPLGAIASYLRIVASEAKSRGYSFDTTKVAKKYYRGKIEVTKGQVEYEFNHLLNKLKSREPKLYESLKDEKTIKVNSMFRQVDGDIENWEVR